MLGITVARGLCAACVNETSCIYPRDPDRPVLNCEEFEMTLRPEPTRRDDSFVKFVESLLRGSATGEYSAKLMGLCSNCDNRETCIYPKPEGGVWHCDEYS